MKLGKKLRCHLKADTGMSRLGVLCTLENLDAAADELEAMYRQPGLEVEGLFQHFADADTCPEYSLMQIQRYNAILHALEERGCTFKLRHCCAGAATLNYPQAHYDMIRPGIPALRLFSRSRLRWHDRRASRSWRSRAASVL